MAAKSRGGGVRRSAGGVWGRVRAPPVRMVETDQVGFQLSGWKSDIERQSRVSGRKRPLGVTIVIDGGLRGYSEGNLTRPQNLRARERCCGLVVGPGRELRRGREGGWRTSRRRTGFRAGRGASSANARCCVRRRPPG